MNVAGKDMCVGVFRLSAFEAEQKPSIRSPSVSGQAYVRVSVECGMHTWRVQKGSYSTTSVSVHIVPQPLKMLFSARSLPLFQKYCKPVPTCLDMAMSSS
jgi:hypothetical protein